mgnify:CR=1 FL=1
MKITNNQKGQSLIEVIAALAIVILVITALAVVVTLSIANAKFSQNQVLASKYSQEVMEKLRSYRDQYTWEEFTENCDGGYLPALSGPWTRTITCTVIDVDIRKVVVKVGWTDAKGRVHESRLETNFTNWKE